VRNANSKGRNYYFGVDLWNRLLQLATVLNYSFNENKKDILTMRETQQKKRNY